MISSGFFFAPLGFLGFFGCLGGAEPGDFEADLVLFEGGSGSGSSEPQWALVLFGMFLNFIHHFNQLTNLEEES